MTVYTPNFYEAQSKHDFFFFSLDELNSSLLLYYILNDKQQRKRLTTESGKYNAATKTPYGRQFIYGFETGCFCLCYYTNSIVSFLH